MGVTGSEAGAATIVGDEEGLERAARGRPAIVDEGRMGKGQGRRESEEEELYTSSKRLSYLVFSRQYHTIFVVR